VRAPLELPKILAKRAKKLGGAPRRGTATAMSTSTTVIFRLTVGKLRRAVPHRKHDDYMVGPRLGLHGDLAWSVAMDFIAHRDRARPLRLPA